MSVRTNQDAGLLSLVGNLEHEQSRAASRAERLKYQLQIARSMLHCDRWGRWKDVLACEQVEGSYYFIRRVWLDKVDPVALAVWNDGWDVLFGQVAETSLPGTAIEQWEWFKESPPE